MSKSSYKIIIYKLQQPSFLTCGQHSLPVWVTSGRGVCWGGEDDWAEEEEREKGVLIPGRKERGRGRGTALPSGNSGLARHPDGLWVTDTATYRTKEKWQCNERQSEKNNKKRKIKESKVTAFVNLLMCKNTH